MPISQHTQSKHPLREWRVQQQIKGREKDERWSMTEIQPKLTFVGIHRERQTSVSLESERKKQNTKSEEKITLNDFCEEIEGVDHI